MTAPVDTEVFSQLSRGNAQLQHDLIRLFREANDEDVLALKDAVIGTDAASVGHSAHRIKGAAKMIGAFALAAIAERIELCNRALDWKGVLAAMNAFDGELARVNAFLATV